MPSKSSLPFEDSDNRSLRRRRGEAAAPPDRRGERVLALVSGARVVGIALLIAIAVLVREVLLLAFFAILIAVALSFPVQRLSKVMPRGLAVLISLVLVLGGLTGLGMASAPVLSAQVQSVARQAPEAVHRLESWYHHSLSGGTAGEADNPRAGNLAEEGMRMVFPAAVGAVEGVSTAILVLVLAAFLVYQPGMYFRGARLLVPKNSEPGFDEGFERLAQGLRRWVAGISVSMLIMGIVTAIGLKVAGIQNWLLLASLTLLGSFIPYLGAIASSVPGLLMGLSQSTHHFFYAGVVYLCVHMTEGYVVQPLVMKRAVELRPAVLLVGQAILGALLGIFGVIVASPLLVCLQIGVGYFYVERKLGKTPKV